MPKEFLIKHDKIKDPQTITKVQEAEFKKHGVDMHINDVMELEDDHDKGVRRLKIKNTKYFFT